MSEGHTLSIHPSPAHAPFPTMTTRGPSSASAVVEHHSSDEDHGAPATKSKGGGTAGKSRRELPAGAVSTLKAWLLSPEHFTHPYPTPQDQIMLMHKTGIDKKQLKNWFTNARRRIWKPMLKKQLEAGKLAAAGGGAVVQAPPGGMVPGGMVPGMDMTASNQPPQQEMYQNYQQAAQGQGQYQDPNQQYYQQQHQQQGQYDPNAQVQQQQPLYDQYGNQVYQDPNQAQQQQQYQDPNQQQQYQPPQQVSQPGMSSNPSNNFSIGSLAPLMPSSGSFGKMIKTDSHAVLMELFARDQDLVRQAAGKGGSQVQQQQAAAAQQPGQASAAAGASGQQGNLRWAQGTAPGASPGMGQKQLSVTFQQVPSLSSWPHFSSVSSLNNLGNLQGVKSITNLSAADLSSQGNLNRMGNLAQVKSSENMGRGDSFAFLEVFFDDKSGIANSTHSSQRGVKREREEDDGAIGLSLDGDDGASPPARRPPGAQQVPAAASGAPKPAPLPEDGKDTQEGGNEDSYKLKRNYDDAVAARGLIAVRRSCEKLTDLDLPNKMQRTLSQEYIRQHNQGQPMGDFFSTNNSQYAPNSRVQPGPMPAPPQYPGQPPVAPNAMGGAQQQVEVPSSTKCALCSDVTVDTQLRPCGHMFHGRCLKPSLQSLSGPPKCPICHTSMQSAILAVPSGQDTQGGMGVNVADASAQ